MKVLVKNANAAQTVSSAAAVAGQVTHPGGDIMMYASGTFTTAVLMFTPSLDLPFVTLKSLSTAGVSQLYAMPGFLRAVLTGTVTAANVVIG